MKAETDDTIIYLNKVLPTEWGARITGGTA